MNLLSVTNKLLKVPHSFLYTILNLIGVTEVQKLAKCVSVYLLAIHIFALVSPLSQFPMVEHTDIFE